MKKMMSNKQEIKSEFLLFYFSLERRWSGISMTDEATEKFLT